MRMPWKKERVPEERDASFGMDYFIELLHTMQFQGATYTLPGQKQEEIGGNLMGVNRAGYQSSAVIFACIDVRAKLFSEARFAFRRRREGRPAGLFTTPALRRLERPWTGATTGDLLYRMEQYASLTGNAFIARTPADTSLMLLRPDWVTIVSGSTQEDSISWDIGADVLGYVYEPGGPGSGRPAVVFLPEEVAHYAPIPDPEARWRGMSWISPVVREVMADKAATDHKLSFYENSATPNLALKWPVEDLDLYRKWIEAFKREHEGRGNAYKTLHLGAGADVTVVGADFQQLDFKVTQGAGETRIAAAAGVPPVIVGFSEGLQGSSLNAGNYQSARRRFADITIRPLWRNAAGSLARIIDVPGDAELWYDDRDISALQEDALDAANVLSTNAQTSRTLIEAGFDPASVVAAVEAEDLTLLRHTGLTSVQLQEPGTTEPAEPAPTNGAVTVPATN